MNYFINIFFKWLLDFILQPQTKGSFSSSVKKSLTSLPIVFVYPANAFLSLFGIYWFLLLIPSSMILKFQAAHRSIWPDHIKTRRSAGYAWQKQSSQSEGQKARKKITENKGNLIKIHFVQV